MPVKKLIISALRCDKTPMNTVKPQILSAVFWTCVLVLLKLH